MGPYLLNITFLSYKLDFRNATCIYFLSAYSNLCLCQLCNIHEEEILPLILPDILLPTFLIFPLVL